MPQYRMSDGVTSETFEAGSIEKAREHAEQWARDGDWDTSEGTVWINVRLSSYDEEAQEFDNWGSERIKVAIDPEAPECNKPEHDWQSPQEIVGGIKENPGVYGHGGGVTIQEVCVHCGCGKLIDTWAQDRETGEQGLNSITYEPGKYPQAVDYYGTNLAAGCEDLRDIPDQK